MARWPMLVAMLGGCVDEPDQGVQIGEEQITQDDPCVFHEEVVGFEDAVFSSGESASDVLSALTLSGTAAPHWNDGGDATIAVDLAWDGGTVTYRTATPAREGESCPEPSVELGIGGTVVSSDGRVDEVVAGSLRLAPGWGDSVDDLVPDEEIGGTLDPWALLDPQIDGDFTASLEVLVHLSPGADVHGALVAMGCVVSDGTTSGTTTGPSDPCTPVEHDVADW